MNSPTPLVVGLAVLLLAASCATSPPPTSTVETLREDLPLVLNRHEGITELLDGVVVGSEIVAVGDGGAIIHSTDSGKTWEKSEVAAQSTLFGVSFAGDAEHGWAVGREGLILASVDGGLTWQKQWQSENRSDWFLDVLSLDQNRVIAIGKNGLYVETSDGGARWTRRSVIDRDSHLNRISRGPSGTLYLAGEHGTVLRSRDEGVAWVQLPSPMDTTLYGILPLDPHTLLAYGGSTAGSIYRSEDNGETWAAIRLVRRGLMVKTGMVTRDGSVLLLGLAGGWREESRDSFVSRDGGHSFGPWKLAMKSGKDYTQNSPTTNLIELLEAPDGSFVAFGPEGATILGH